MTNIHNSYKSHTANIDNLLDTQDERLFHIRNHDCVRHKMIDRTLQLLKPFLAERNTWLTVGDFDAAEGNFLKINGQQACSSDLSDALLKIAKHEGLIDNCQSLNIEQSQLADNSYDYVSCKEAFHHFPRAFLGLHEMIRIAQKATIIIEPIDIISRMPMVLWIKNILDIFDPQLINRVWKNRFSFETVGNFVFKISERDIERIAMGMGLPYIAFKGINIHLSDGSEEGMAQVPHHKALWQRLISKLARKDFLARLHLIPHNHLCCVIFKQQPSDTLLHALKKDGYKIIKLPKNPYLD